MFCPHCGAEIKNISKFCTDCGSPLPQKNSAQSNSVEGNNFQGNNPRNIPEPPFTDNNIISDKPLKRKRKPTAKKMIRDGQMVTQNIAYCADGKYRWIYELSIIKNPTIFLLVWKIFFFIILGIYALTFIIDLVGGDMDGERFLESLKMFGIFFIGMTVLVALGVLVYAAIMGGKYCVMFEMDENGILHKQLPRQVKKAQAIGIVTALMGAASGNLTTIGVGLNASANTEMYSEFAKVRSVKPYPRRNLIKVNQTFGKNQVYADNADFSFVLDYIRSHVLEQSGSLKN